MAPIYIDVFLSPIRDNTAAQVGVTAVLVFIFLDVLFGVINALFQHKYSSEKMRQGIAHKSAEIGFLLVGVVCDGTLSAGLDFFGFTAPVLICICGYLCIMELGSLLETFADMNPQAADTLGPLFKLLDSVHVTEHDRTLLEAMPTDTASDPYIPEQHTGVEE